MLRAVLDDLLGTLLPSACAGCAAPASALCERCRRTLRAAPAVAPPPGVDWWVAAFRYEGVVRDVVTRAKYRDARAGLAFLAGAVAASCPSPLPVESVTWVPASRARLRARGVDHGRLLARGVARELALPARALLRRDGGASQTGRPGRVRRAGPVLHAPRGSPRRVLVVDDVVTTGATAVAAARALRQAGAAFVGFAAAARTARAVGEGTAPPLPILGSDATGH